MPVAIFSPAPVRPAPSWSRPDDRYRKPLWRALGSQIPRWSDAVYQAYKTTTRKSSRSISQSVSNVERGWSIFSVSLFAMFYIFIVYLWALSSYFHWIRHLTTSTASSTPSSNPPCQHVSGLILQSHTPTSSNQSSPRTWHGTLPSAPPESSWLGNRCGQSQTRIC